MKEPTYTADCWQGYTDFIKETLNRVLTKKEYSLMMDAYIHKRPIEDLLEELK